MPFSFNILQQTPQSVKSSTLGCLHCGCNLDTGCDMLTQQAKRRLGCFSERRGNDFNRNNCVTYVDCVCSLSCGVYIPWQGV